MTLYSTFDIVVGSTQKPHPQYAFPRFGSRRKVSLILLPNSLILLQHNTSAEGDGLVRQICKAYKGSNRPKACVL
jgi:hypothetical protein